jgi:hypothetical protein
MSEAAKQYVVVPERPKLSCLIFGHRAANRTNCECLERSLTEDGRLTHVRHIMTCFLGGHTYKRLTDRAGHHEYICQSCGHQWLVSADADPFETTESFVKRPRYWCSVFGHRVYSIGERHGLTEYVCPCGHSFMTPRKSVKKVKHPVTCTLLGHFVRHLCDRLGFSEYVCGICGHTFCYTKRKTL